MLNTYTVRRADLDKKVLDVTFPDEPQVTTETQKHYIKTDGYRWNKKETDDGYEIHEEIDNSDPMMQWFFKYYIIKEVVTNDGRYDFIRGIEKLKAQVENMKAQGYTLRKEDVRRLGAAARKAKRMKKEMMTEEMAAFNKRWGIEA